MNINYVSWGVMLLGIIIMLSCVLYMAFKTDILLGFMGVGGVLLCGGYISEEIYRGYQNGYFDIRKD